MKNIVLEELNRVKLLMSYDSKNTLSENIEIINLVESKKIISEQGAKAFLKAMFGAPDDIARALKNGVADAKYAAGVKLFKGITVTGVSTSDDLMQALLKGTLSRAQLSELAKGLMKTGKVKGDLRIALTDRAAELAVKDARYANMTQNQVKNSLIKKGYNSDIADVIASKFVNKRSTTLVKPSTTGTKTGNKTGNKTGGTTTRRKKTTVKSTDYTPDPSKVTIWQNIKGRIAGMARGKIFKYLLIAGGLYLVWKWWTDEGSAPFPDCIGKNIPKEDFEKMVNDGLDYVLITDTGNSTIDQNGGGRFFDDKDFTTGNGKYSGTWSEKDGGIVITINGTDYSISCEGMNDDDDDDDNDGGNGGGGNGGGGNGGGNSDSYKVCDSFPLTKGCSGSKVSEFQKCIGVTADGKFGPKTEQKLKDKGYSTTVTQEVYDKILKNCGSSNSDNKILTPDAGSAADDL
jgi:hypothetical protein